MPQLVHGGDIYSAQERYGGPVLDFSANINPLGLPEGVRRAVESCLPQCVHYPDPLCRELTAAIAAFEEVRPEWILCGNGAADLLFRLVFSRRPKKALVLAPTFAEYEQALEAVGCQVVHYVLRSENEFMLDDGILDALTEDLDMAFVCNPNNPTGQPVPTEKMEQILAKCREKNILLVADECFNDFLDDPELYTLKGSLAGKGLFILRAFTKQYAMAGLRLGFCFCADREILEGMSRCGQPWSVSIPAQTAGVQALREEEYRFRTTEVIPEERAYLKEKMGALGLRVIGSHANYIFFQAPGCTDLRERLAEHGIIIRSCANYHGLDGTYYRIGVRLRDDNERLIQQLIKVL